MGATATTLAITGGGVGAYSSLAAGEFNNDIAQANAYYADLQAQDALVRGNELEGVYRQRTRGIIAEQRTTLAAQGVEVNSGTALVLQQDAAEIGEIEALTIRNNAQREAFGFNVQAQNFRMQGELAEFEGKLGAISSLLGGGSQASSFYK